MEKQSLSRYIDVSEEELLAATRTEKILSHWNGEDNTAPAQVNARAHRKMDNKTTSRTIS